MKLLRTVAATAALLFSSNAMASWIGGLVYCDVNMNGEYDEGIDIPLSGVQLIIETADGEAHRILREHLEVLHGLADALLEHEIINGDDIDTIMRGEKVLPKDEEYLNGAAASDEKVADDAKPSEETGTEESA